MLRITINGAIESGPSWEAVQGLVMSMVGKAGRLTRIARRRGGANYRATSGVYDCEFVPTESGDMVEIVLSVNPEREINPVISLREDLKRRRKL